MSVDVVDLREFYATELGRSACHSIAKTATKQIQFDDIEDILGFGYPVAFFDDLLSNNDKAIILMPARQGAIQWPKDKANRTILSEDDELPFATGSLQCVFMVHALENAADPALVLDEIWRVLVPEGKLILLATNRRGLWARFESTPFGNGRPFSKRQLSDLLRNAKLSPIHWEACLNFPPINNKWLLRIAPYIEAIASRLWPIFCGAHFVIANKRLYQGVLKKSQKAKHVRMPVLTPHSARSRNSRSSQ